MNNAGLGIMRQCPKIYSTLSFTPLLKYILEHVPYIQYLLVGETCNTSTSSLAPATLLVDCDQINKSEYLGTLEMMFRHDLATVSVLR